MKGIGKENIQEKIKMYKIDGENQCTKVSKGPYCFFNKIGEGAY